MPRLLWNRVYAVLVSAVVGSLVLNLILPAFSFSATAYAESQFPQNNSGKSEFVANTVRKQRVHETSLRTLDGGAAAQRAPAPPAPRKDSVLALGSKPTGTNERPAFSLGPQPYTNAMANSRDGNCGAQSGVPTEIRGIPSTPAQVAKTIM